MTEIAHKFLELINCAQNNENFGIDSSTELSELHAMSVKNSLTAVLFNGLTKVTSSDEETNNIIAAWKRETLFSSISQLKSNAELQRVILSFEDNSITYAVFKGITLSILYPQDGTRHSGDADIWVAEQDFDRAYALLKSMGYYKDEDNSKDCVYNMRSASLYIEMHKYLWEDYTGKKIDKIKELRWTEPASFVKVPVGKYEYTSLGYTEHLEYMFFHTIKHYVYKGFGIRHLLDVTLYVNRYAEKIDVCRFWKDMKTVGYGVFCHTALASCVRYLGMNKGILAGKAELDEAFLERFILAAIDSGTFGDPLVRTAELDGFYDEKSNDNRKLRSIFPTYKEMKRQYEWLKSPSLLPAAWIYRVFKFALNPELVKAKKDHLKDDELRQALMQELELK